jgi:hypothetical protein
MCSQQPTQCGDRQSLTQSSREVHMHHIFPAMYDVSLPTNES